MNKLLPDPSAPTGDPMSPQLRDVPPPFDEPPEPESQWFDDASTSEPPKPAAQALPSPPAQTDERERWPLIPPSRAVPAVYPPRARKEIPEQPTTQPNGPLHVIINRTGDQRTDSDRLQAVHGTLLLFQGEHKFSIRLRNGGTKDVLIDFPNDGTRDCAELRDMLRAMGAECLK